jgi:hypothetical protein
MIYVAAEPPRRMPPAMTGAARGPTVLVVPVEGLVNGRPRGIRGGMLPTLDVSGCRGFVLGARREVERPRPGDEREVSAA